MSARRHALIVAFHFPPFAASSGVQRALRIAQYLPEFDWDCTVLTVTPGAYDQIEPDSIDHLPTGVRIVRAPCLNAARHLAIARRYPRRLAVPDRWASWQYTGALAGVRICRRNAIDLVWSTYPIATAHRVADAVVKRTGLPWVADFRDPMVQDGYPEDPALMAAFTNIEKDIAAHAAAMVFTTRSAQRVYQARFPGLPARCFNVIENGFDDDGFASHTTRAASAACGVHRRVLVHSGFIYPEERNPRPLFEALARLHQAGTIHSGRLLVRFRAPRQRALLLELSAKYGLTDMIELGDPLPHAAAIQEMQQADGLLLMQANTCNEQIPAKLYEYLRAGRPILGLADPAGETGARLAELGFPHGVALEDVNGIERSVPAFLGDLEAGREYRVSDEVLATMTRRHGVAKLAALFDRIVLDGQARIGSAGLPADAMRVRSGRLVAQRSSARVMP